MKKMIVFLTLFLSFLNFVHAQTPNPIWAVTYGTSSDFNQSLCCAVDQSGGLYVVGYTQYYPHGNYLIIKYNTTTGNIIWQKTFDGNPGDPDNNNDIAMGCTVDNSGNLYVTGMSSGTLTNNDILTIKYNTTNGDTIWTRKYNGSSNGPDAGTACALDGSGNLYIGGLSQNAANTDFCLLKYNATNGNLIWARNYPSPLGNKGEAYGCSVSGSSVFLNGYIYTGTNYNLFTVKCNTSNGDTVWTRINHEGLDSLMFIHSDCIADNSGNVFTTGNCSNGTSGIYCRTIKYDATGIILWSKIFERPLNNPLNDFSGGLALDPMGNLLVTGSTRETGAYTGGSLLLIRYNSATGDTIWAKEYPAGRQGIGCVTDASGFIYVTGRPDFWGWLTIKYDNTGMLVVTDYHPEMDDFLVYPDPVSTTLNIQLPPFAETVEIYTMQGIKCIEEKPVTSPYTIDVETLPSGIYLVAVSGKSGRIAWKKFIKLI